jgi:hypothetical protein
LQPVAVLLKRGNAVVPKRRVLLDIKKSDNKEKANLK